MNRSLPIALALFAAGVLLSGSLPAQQKIYQWKDAQGRLHYSGSPPSSGNYQVRGVSAAPATPVAGKTAAAENPQCTQARKNLGVLRANNNVQIDSDGDGKPDRTLSSDEHANQLKLAESTIAATCTPAKP